MLLLLNTFGDALVIAESRVVQVEQVDIDESVASDFLQQRDVKLAVPIVEPVLRGIGAHGVEIGAVEVYGNATVEPTLLVRRSDVPDMLRLSRQRRIVGSTGEMCGGAGVG